MLDVGAIHAASNILLGTIREGEKHVADELVLCSSVEVPLQVPSVMSIALKSFHF